MRCLYLTQELAPYFAEGGLGLSAATLPIALHQVAGIEFTIMVPYYPWLVDQCRLYTELVAELPPVTIGQRREPATIHRVLNIPGPCEVLLVRSDAWYQRNGGIYRDHDYVEYEDAIPRAAFFGWCAQRWLESNPDRFSLVHGNDWQSGMAMFLCARARQAAAAPRPALLYEIHLAEWEPPSATNTSGSSTKPARRPRGPGGAIEPHVLPTLGLDAADQSALEEIGRGDPSMMLLGLTAADALVTCSPTYASELSEHLARSPMIEPIRRLGLTGIVSGIDTEVWNPAGPDAPVDPYTVETVQEGKRRNKQSLQALCNFRHDPNKPLYGICARLVPEKGIDLVLRVIEPLLRSDCLQLVVMGIGERAYVEAFRRLEVEFPGSVCYFPAFDMSVAQRLYAGCDFTLMPSLSEPCGLNQLISMRYGTLPIVTSVGGLRDTVTDVGCAPKDGLGFVLSDISADALRAAIERSITWLSDDDGIVKKTRQRTMQQDWSWERAALKYVSLYQTAIDRANAYQTQGATQ